MPIDIVGVKKFYMKEDNTFESLAEYLIIAKKMVCSSKICGTSIQNEMLNNEDAISNIAYYIMLADSRYDGRGSRFGFRAMYARYAIKNYLSRRKKELNKHTFSMFAIGEEDDFIDNTLSRDNPESNILGADIRQTLLDAIETNLSDKQADYIKKHYFDGMTISEIAKDMDVTKQNVYTMIQRGLKKLKRVIDIEEIL